MPSENTGSCRSSDYSIRNVGHDVSDVESRGDFNSPPDDSTCASAQQWREAWDETFAWTPEALRTIRVAGDAVAAQADRYREAIASALTSLGTGPMVDGYAYAILKEAVDAD